MMSHELPLNDEDSEWGHRIRRLEQEPCTAMDISDYSLGWHVASIFIILVVSILGVGLPLVAKRCQKLGIPPYGVVLGKCAGIGVMLACSLVHMIQPSSESLTSECVPPFFSTTYPAFSYVVVLLSALTVHLGEFLLTSVLENDDENKLDQSQNSSCTSSEENRVDEEGRGDCRESPNQDEKAPPIMEQEAKTLQAKMFSEAIMVEFSLSVHSILIGVAAGVTDHSTLMVLLVALAFHQMLEGVALGARLSDSTLSVKNEVLFAAVFSVSAPLGIIIGMCVYSSVNMNGETYMLVQGTFDAICGGILVYTGFLMLVEDFPKDMKKHCIGERRRLMKAGMFVVLWVSAIFMSLIGVWL